MQLFQKHTHTHKHETGSAPGSFVPHGASPEHRALRRAPGQRVLVRLQEILNQSLNQLLELFFQHTSVTAPGQRTHLGVVLDLGLGAARAQRGHAAILEGERDHLAALAHWQHRLLVQLAAVIASGDVSDV